MAHSNTVFHNLLKLIPRHEFENIVRKVKGNRYVKTFSCWNQFTALLFAQVTGKESLRDIEQGLAVNHSKLYHLGLPVIKKSTLADANKKRNYHIYESLFYKLLERCQNLTPTHKFRFKNELCSFDATTISLCLSSFPWSRFGKTKGALKMHCQLNHSGNIPDFMVVTPGFENDVSVAKKIFTFKPDSIYCFDRGYNDYVFYRRINDAKAFFVTRTKETMNYEITGQHTETMKKGILSDERIMLNNKKYKKELRLIRYYDQETGKCFEYLTNNFRLAPFTIVEIYRNRWQIESFFKWIKQNLKIKSFLGTHQNAVLTQIWVAMCYYLLLAYIKFQTKYKHSLFYLHRVIKDTLLERFLIIDLLRSTPAKRNRLNFEELQFTFF